MPIYQYQCPECGSSHEVIQKLSDPALDICPECGSRKVEKIASTFAIGVRERSVTQPKGVQAVGHRSCSVLDLSVPSRFRHPYLTFPLVKGDLPQVKGTKREKKE
jgi:putative FmdB family regulatory protein